MKLLKKYDQYIKGQLSEEEMDTFTKDIVQEHFEEEQLKNQWKTILDQDEELQALKNQQASDSPKLVASRPKGIRRFKILFQVAATVLLLIAAGLFFYEAPDPIPVLSYAQLTEVHLEKPYSNSGSRSGALESSEIRIQANDAYRQKNYAQAIPLFQELNSLPEKQSSDVFYLGLSHLYLGEYDLAIKNLEIIHSDTGSSLHKESSWFLSLAYLKANQLDAAKNILQNLADSKGWKSQDAQLLLQAIN